MQAETHMSDFFFQFQLTFSRDRPADLSAISGNQSSLSLVSIIYDQFFVCRAKRNLFNIPVIPVDSCTGALFSIYMPALLVRVRTLLD